MGLGNVALWRADVTTEVVLKSITYLGRNSIYYEDNGFAIAYMDYTDQWVLAGTPDTEYDVPDSVAGISIDLYPTQCMSGTPTFTKLVPVTCEGDHSYTGPNKIIWEVAPDWQTFNIKRWNGNSSIDSPIELDLSACDENLNIPEELLGSEDFIIYVSTTEKANYADYDNIVAK